MRVGRGVSSVGKSLFECVWCEQELKKQRAEERLKLAEEMRKMQVRCQSCLGRRAHTDGGGRGGVTSLSSYSPCGSRLQERLQQLEGE